MTIILSRKFPLSRGLWLLSLLALILSATQAHARTILFVGNSFTYGGFSAVWKYRAEKVQDLNGGGFGGVPALFAMFAGQAHLDYEVSLETAGGRTLQWHWDHKRPLLDRAWDDVVLQDYSTLDPADPGNPAGLITYSGKFADLFRARNRQAAVYLMSTWSRADLTYLPGKPWFGKGIYAMAADLRRGYDQAARRSAAIKAVIPVGEAFNLAMVQGVADSNPYDDISRGQTSLWTYDHYHASTTGTYLEALVVFARVTGIDPRTLGRGEHAAGELGISPELAERLQQIAAAATVPAP